MPLWHDSVALSDKVKALPGQNFRKHWGLVMCQSYFVAVIHYSHGWWYMTQYFLQQGKLVEKVTQGDAEQDPRFWMVVNVVTHKHLAAHTAAEHFDLMDRDKVCMVHLGPWSPLGLCKGPAFSILTCPIELNFAEAWQNDLRQDVKECCLVVSHG